MKPAWWRLLLTEADNATPSVFRALALSLSVHMAVLASWIVFVARQPLDFQAYATGLAAIWAAAGLGERLAGTHQPKGPADEPPPADL